MKIVPRQPHRTADVSAARHTAFRELFRLAIIVGALAIVAYLALGTALDLVVPRISYETEQRIFGLLPVQAFTGGEESAALARPDRILRRLVSDPEVPRLPYRLVLLDIDQPNAVAFPGGTIGVTKGLLAALDDEIPVAFVLGHELGHFRNRDHLRGLGRALGAGVLYAIVFGNQMSSGTLQTLAPQIIERTYSRRQEDAADRFSVRLVARVYGRTEGAERLFRILGDAERLPRWAYMFSTHPSPTARIRRLREYARGAGG